MLDFNDALKRILDQVPALDEESAPLSELKGRVLSASIYSDIDLPVANNSSMDGYAVRAADLEQAGKEHPILLRVVGVVPAGTVSDAVVESRTCVRLFTGSFLPEGADAVIMQEDTSEVVGGEQIRCLDRVKPRENIRFKGEDVEKGDLLLESGTRLHIRHLGMVAATGCAEAKVARRPRVAILATGHELQSPGEVLRPGAIYESNRIVLGEMVAMCGGLPKICPLVQDDLASTKVALRVAAEENDAVITSGGVSVGDYDLIRPAIEALGGHIDFWRIRLRPGKPFVFAEVFGKPLFGLPGNPVSAITTFMLLARPALLKMQGASDVRPPQLKGRLVETLTNQSDRPHFMRVYLNENREVTSAGLQDSHALQSLSKANAWLCVEPGQTLSSGEEVSLIAWDS